MQKILGARSCRMYDYIKSGQNYVGIIRSGRQLILTSDTNRQGEKELTFGRETDVHRRSCSAQLNRGEKGIIQEFTCKYLPGANTFASER